jgi:two-component system OmpR family response regulator
MKILVVEDDAQTAAYVADGLRERWHEVDVARDGREGLVLAASGSYDVMIVDRMLPGLDGIGLIKTIRGVGVRTPVLVLSARGSVPDRVSGLDAGGDDYLVKPFALSELLARVNALGRRPTGAIPDTTLRVADLEMDLLKRTVQRAGRQIELQPREFQLLEFLLRHAGEVVTRTMLLEGVWEFHFDPQTNVIDTHISRLRAKVDRGFDVALIHTVRGAGYVIRAPE